MTLMMATSQIALVHFLKSQFTHRKKQQHIICLVNTRKDWDFFLEISLEMQSLWNLLTVKSAVVKIAEKLFLERSRRSSTDSIPFTSILLWWRQKPLMHISQSLEQQQQQPTTKNRQESLKDVSRNVHIDLKVKMKWKMHFSPFWILSLLTVCTYLTMYAKIITKNVYMKV